MTEVTHAGTTPAVETGAETATDPAAADRVVAQDLTQVPAGEPLTDAMVEVCRGVYPAGTVLTAARVRAAARLAEVRLVARTLAHYVMDPEMLALAAVLDGAADREAAYLADPGDEIDDAGPGEESWLAWAIARVFLGQEVPDVG
jgi:hypothetical protein